MILLLCALLASAASAGADVYFEEEVVNRGFGKDKIGARKTTNKIYIKGKSQRVEQLIEADAKTAKALRHQGQSLNTSTILRLDQAQVYEIDLTAQTFVQQKAPPARKAVAKPEAAPGGPQRALAVKVPGDTESIAGIPCRRVVAQMRTRYLDPKTQELRRENRYTYDACIAKKFPGFQEIGAFMDLQDASTSYPSLIGGGLEGLEDHESLSEGLENAEELKGFALRSTLTAAVKLPGNEKPSQVFRLDRKIKVMAYAPLPDSLFHVSKALTRLKSE
jgi:hypothetical protein